MQRRWTLVLAGVAAAGCWAADPATDVLQTLPGRTFRELRPSEPRARAPSVREQIEEWIGRLPSGSRVEERSAGGIWWVCRVPERAPCLLITENGYIDWIAGTMLDALGDLDGDGLPEALIRTEDANRARVVVVTVKDSGPEQVSVDGMPELALIRELRWENRDGSVGCFSSGSIRPAGT